MERKEYSVSEAVRLIGVESHVLRYWEEELRIEIRRSAQGHRIYSEEDIETFRRVRELKDKGLQLKAIRLLMEGRKARQSGTDMAQDGFERQVRELVEGALSGDMLSESAPSKNPLPESAPSEDPFPEDMCSEDMLSEDVGYEIIAAEEEPGDMHRFEMILRRLMEDVLSEQNEKLEQAIAGRLRDELEDFCLQYYQIVREAAAAAEQQPGRIRRAARRLRKLICGERKE